MNHSFKPCLLPRGERRRGRAAMSEETESSPVSSPVSCTKDLSEFQKGQVMGAYIGGLSIKQVSRMCNVSSHAVSEILDVYKLYLQLTPRLKRKTLTVKTRKRLKKTTRTPRKKRAEEGGSAKNTGTDTKQQQAHTEN